ncbi:MAG: phosphatidate phosphatase APP1 [Myxococcota bacterium]|jgi:phosphatidate phosphatase APP1
MATMKRALWPAIFCVVAALGTAGCDEGTAELAEVDLGILAAKADGVTLRQADVRLAPGQIQRFRVKTVAFRASLEQSTDTDVQLSGKSFDIDVYGDSARAAELEVEGDGTTRTWTVRVENVGRKTLVGTLHVLDWDVPEDAETYVGVLGDELRRVAVKVEPGETVRFRIPTTRFHAALTQTTKVDAQLSAKHYEIDIYGDVTQDATVEAVTEVDQLRNWTLRVANLGDTILEGEVVVHALLTEPTREIGIISDIDKTLLPPKLADGSLPAPYPGVTTLYRTLEFGDDGNALGGDMFFVTARTDARVAEVPAWMDKHDVPEGSISTGISGIPWIAQSEKVRDFSAILEAFPDTRFVIFGDSSHRDPEAYNEVIAKFPGRIIAGFIHKVNNANPDRIGALNLIENYAEAAAILFGVGVLDETAARRVIAAARAEGLDIDDIAVEALLDAQRARNAQPPG